MLKEKDGKIVVPKRFMEWLNKTERPNNSYQIALINRVGLGCGWGFGLGIHLEYNDETYTDLTGFVNGNKKQLTRALLDKKEFVAEQEKKYYMVAPDEFRMTARYLNFDTNKNKYFLNTKVDSGESKTQFTRSEINAMPQKFRDFFRQVEAE